MKILLTGASGFIGRNLYEYLTDRNYDVVAPKHSELDLLSLDSVKAFFQENAIDLIIHTANINTSRNHTHTAYDSLDGNLRMFYNLISCREQYKKMYYFGSGAEYDSKHYIPQMKEEYFGENIPTDSYGFSKYIMSDYASKADGMVDFRLFGVYGRYEEWERRFISNAICRALKGMDITLEKHMKFDYLWVDDLCRIVEYFINNNPKHTHYNICRGKTMDLYDLALIVQEVTGVGANIVVKSEGMKPEYSGSNRLMMEELGNFSFTPVRETVEELVKYYKEHIEEIDETKLV